MRIFVVFAIFFAALMVGVIAKECGDNKPDCAEGSSGRSRYNYDPNYYWECENGEATKKRCEQEQYFDYKSGECTPFNGQPWEEPTC